MPPLTIPLLIRFRVVIIGQDPYHGPGQANGLSFSVSEGIRLPPSLKNIFKEISNDLGYNIPHSGDLSPWANQGVLMLNAVLTVRHKTSGIASKKRLGKLHRCCNSKNLQRKNRGYFSPLGQFCSFKEIADRFFPASHSGSSSSLSIFGPYRLFRLWTFFKDKCHFRRTRTNTHQLEN